MKLSATPMIDWPFDIGTLSHTYHHTAIKTVGCGVREREPGEKDPWAR